MNVTKKKLLIVAAVSALTVATAVPAMALENEFHGMFKIRGIISNYDDGSAGRLLPSRTPETKNYIEQRARLLYMAKANDDLKLVTHFEIDSRWGDNSYNSNNTTRNNGGALGADQVNLETKSVYLDFNVPGTPVPVNVKVGIQPYLDAYKGIIFSNDAAGVVATSSFDKVSTRLSYFRFYDNLKTDKTPANNTNGYLTQDFVNLDGKYSITKDLKVGGSYFLLYDDRSRVTSPRVNVHMIGVNAEAKVGPATLDGFFIYQTGKAGVISDAAASSAASSAQPFKTVNAFAANVGGKAKVGPGTARVNALYISGDGSVNSGTSRNDFITINGVEHSFYPGEMMLLLRSKHALNTDRAIVYSLNNANQGLIGGFLGYDLSINKFFVNSNLGMAAVAKNATTKSNNYMGTEINTEIGYKLFDNMSASVQAAYLVVGGYFAGTGAGGKNPENPYSTRVVLNYLF
jgi:hypothetical protein